MRAKNIERILLNIVNKNGFGASAATPTGICIEVASKNMVMVWDDQAKTYLSTKQFRRLEKKVKKASKGTMYYGEFWSMISFY